KPKDRPKRPLSAYNIFFKEERNRILNNNDSNKTDDIDSTISFESLAKIIGQRWQELDAISMAIYKSKANIDMNRY
ncbi:hypothetical protein FRACYDRAFT_145422, partial [Fragilariopsis cylindrus CCMP1102]